MQGDLLARRVGPPLQVMEDVLRDDDGGVDEEPDGDGQAAKGHRVDADTGGAQQQPRQGDRQRQRQGDEQGRAPVAKEDEQHDDDQAGADEDGAADAAERRFHEARLVVDHPEGHARRQRPADIGNGLAHGGGDRHRVRAELLHDAAAHHLPRQPVRDAAPDRRRFADVGDVAEHDRDALVNGDDGGAELLDGLHAADRAHGPLGAALHDEAAGRVDVRVLHGVHHLVERHVPGRHPRRDRAGFETGGGSRQAARPRPRPAPRADGS